MHFSRLDAYFHVASHGDQEAYSLLYKEFVKQAKKVIKTTINIGSNFSSISNDFSEYIDELFFKAINEYESERGSFSRYVEFLLQMKLGRKVMIALAEDQQNLAFFEQLSDEERSIETLADPNEHPAQKALAISDFKLKLASRNKFRTKEQRIRDRIMLLQYAGYNKSEICKMLKITYGELRGYLKRMQNDNSIIKLNLDLK